MSDFKNVTVRKAANIYFDGNVTSRVINFDDGSKKTLGIMLPGEYEFGTEHKEYIEILNGKVEIKLPNEDWQLKEAGDSFYVPGNSKFQLRVKAVVDYCCSYLQE